MKIDEKITHCFLVRNKLTVNQVPEPLKVKKLLHLQRNFQI